MRLESGLALSLILCLPLTSWAQFQRKSKEEPKEDVDPRLVAVLMSHAVDRSSGGDPKLVEFSPDSQTLYVAGPCGAVDAAPKGRDTSSGRIGSIRSSVDDAINDGGNPARPKRSIRSATAATAFRMSDGGVAATFVALPTGRTLTEGLGSADLSPDGTYLAGIGQRSYGLYVFDAKSGKVLAFIDREGRDILSFEKVAFISVGGKLQILTEATHELRLHDVPSGELKDRIDLNDRKFSSQGGLTATPDGKFFGVDTSVWDSTTAEHLSHRKQSSSFDSQITPSGRAVLIPYAKELQRWDRYDAAPVTILTDESRGYMTSIAVSTDEKLLAIAHSPNSYSNGPASIDVIDYQKESHICRLKGHLASVHAMAFSPDSKRLASASRDGSTRIWNVETQE